MVVPNNDDDSDVPVVFVAFLVLMEFVLVLVDVDVAADFLFTPPLGALNLDFDNGAARIIKGLDADAIVLPDI